MAKRKTSAKQRAAARKNIKKAQRARKKGHTKPKRKYTKRGTRKTSTGGRKTAKRRYTRKKKGTRKGQGVIPWALNLAALGIAVSPIIGAASSAAKQPEGSKWNNFASDCIGMYTGIAVDPSTMEYVGWDHKLLFKGYALDWCETPGPAQSTSVYV